MKKIIILLFFIAFKSLGQSPILSAYLKINDSLGILDLKRIETKIKNFNQKFSNHTQLPFYNKILL